MHSQTHRIGPHWLALFALLAGMLASSPSAHAQSGSGIAGDTAVLNPPPLVPWYNWDNSAFYIGAYINSRDSGGRISEMWNFMDALGIHAHEPIGHPIGEAPNGSVDDADFDTLAWTANLGTHPLHRYTAHEQMSGLGREVQFYPFDSTQSQYILMRFEHRQGGDTATNPTVVVNGRKFLEQVYDSTTTTAGDTILQHISYNPVEYDSRQRYRWPSETGNPDSVQVTEQWVEDMLRIHNQGIPAATRNYLVVTGHLFNLGNSNLTDNLLRIEVVYEVPQGKQFYRANGTIGTAGSNQRFIDTIILVRKSDLLPVDPVFPNWDEYRELIVPIDLRTLANGARGPMHNDVWPNAAFSHRFDIRVQWLGGEKVALRSVALRDSIGEMMLGSDSTARAWRQAHVIEQVRRWIYGPMPGTYTPDAMRTDSIRRSLLGIRGCWERYPTMYAGQAVFNRILRDTFNFPNAINPAQRDTMNIAGGQTDYGNPFHFHSLYAPQTVVCEVYPFQGLPRWGADSAWLRTIFGVPHATIPAIWEMNGGKWRLPELDIWNANAVEDYELTLQRLYFGQNMVLMAGGGTGAPNHDLWRSSLQFVPNGLGRPARVSRATGRRFVPEVSNNTFIEFRYTNDTGGAVTVADPMVGHIPSPSETLMLINMTLAYGAKGITWYYVGEGTRMLFNNGTVWGGGPQSLGPVGYYFHDSSAIRPATYPFFQAWTEPPVTRITLDSFYIGYGHRSGMIRWINQEYLPRIGAELMKLTWRDAYSMHYDSAWEQRFSGFDPIDFGYRPLPDSEIVTRVWSYKIGDSIPDPRNATYVEIGLFDKKTDTNAVHQRINDTNYIFVVNRRAFERPYWIDSSSTRGQRMDEIAEGRCIKLKLHLPNHPDSSSYNFIRVREVAPDSTPMPHAQRTLRHVLDTAIYADSAVSVLLGPGRATLLEITYLPPGNAIVNAALPRNGQRKVVYSGMRYYAVYDRIDSSTGMGKVYYHRSYRMRYPLPGDTLASFGSIIWEPVEYELSNDPTGTRYDHRTPSITMRIDTLMSGGAVVSRDTVLTAVWSARNYEWDPDYREIVLRNIHHNGDGAATMPLPAIETVDTVFAPNPMEWGTPVVSLLYPGYVISYSESPGVVKSKYRPRAHGPNWWNSAGTYTWPPVVVNFPTLPKTSAQYPTMPAFTQIHDNDSTVGIAWGSFDSLMNRHDIYYSRLVLDTTGTFRRSVHPVTWISMGEGNHYHPSLDYHQFIWGSNLEGLTWETVESGILDVDSLDFHHFYDRIGINFSTLHTPLPVGGRTNIAQTQHWLNRIRYIDTVLIGVPMYYPNTASLNTRYDSTAYNDPILFSLVYADNNSPYPRMRQDLIQLAEDFMWPAPIDYSWGGRYPNTSATWIRKADWLADSIDPVVGNIGWNLRAEGWDRQPLRPMVMYQAIENGDSVIRTSRQFLMAKVRPAGYMATGRRVLFRLHDSLQTLIGVYLHDVWMATDSLSSQLAMVRRDSSQRKTDSLGQVAPLLRTYSFTASDSVQVGYEIGGYFIGDSAAAGSAAVTCYVDLVDSASGAVVAVLDSFAIANASPKFHKADAPVVDLLSGSYYVRLRLVPTSLPAIDTTGYSRYPVDEIASWIENPPMGKLRRIGATTGAQARLTAYPNPSTGATEIRFSVPKRDYISVTVYDGMGREVARPVARGIMDAGRFAIDFDGTRLQAGSYLVELRTSDERVVEKLVVVR